MKNLKSQILDTQEVSVALELVLSTLDSEVKRIYDIGANAMKAQDNSTALEVINFSEKLKPFISKVESLIKDWNNIIEEKEKASEKVQEILDKSSTIYGDKTRKTSTGFKRDVKNNLAPQTNLTVKFADGTVITNHNAYETFVQAIEYTYLTIVFLSAISIAQKSSGTLALAGASVIRYFPFPQSLYSQTRMQLFFWPLPSA
jgi:hypothetical protein